ncbi:hypothetical protein RA11412_2784 [Rothia aeria]|uniref:Uncharacterized protein n=1 Tax=Rothia aeria TaxID=172042 RepID=A0A2Z5R304_9MICC|nr:hypothetical protein RA11412_2784 [Rothia aeria]
MRQLVAHLLVLLVVPPVPQVVARLVQLRVQHPVGQTAT